MKNIGNLPPSYPKNDYFCTFVLGNAYYGHSQSSNNQ